MLKNVGTMVNMDSVKKFLLDINRQAYPLVVFRKMVIFKSFEFSSGNGPGHCPDSVW